MMINENMQKNELDDKLNKCLEDMSEAKRCKKLYKSTKEDCDKLKSKWEELKEQLQKEQHDVDKLTKITFTNFLHTIMNDKTEQLDKEQREAIEAKQKCDSVYIQLQDSQTLLEKLKSRYDKLSKAEDEYKSLLEDKRKYILANMPDKWEEIKNLMDEDRTINDVLKEIREAIDAGSKTLSCIDNAKSSLDSAHSWGTLDMLGGGAISTMAKRQNMSDAQEYMSGMQKHMSLFARELKDVNTDVIADLEIDGFLGFADYFFDGFFVDWAVQSKIEGAQNKVYDTGLQVEKIIDSLKLQKKELDGKKRQINDRIKEIIREA